MIKSLLINLYNRIYPYLRQLRFNLRYWFRVMSPEATIAYIKKKNCSIARYGDGEFGIITKSNAPDFQVMDEKLAIRLVEICNTTDPRVLICIPHNFKTTHDCNNFAKEFWTWWCWGSGNLETVAKILGLQSWHCRLFGDAQVTRPYMDWKNKSKACKRFKAIMDIWYGRDILIVEGEATKFGVGNDLLLGAKSIARILAPSKNAFAVYEEIKNATIQFSKDRLVLIALGPTATVLAYDLSMLDIQALDIGHIDIEYEWFLSGATEKTAVNGKAVQEVHDESREQTEDIEEDAYSYYQSQIIKRIGC